MRHNILLIIETILIASISILWCEIGYYYFVFYFNCSSWPGIGSFGESDGNNLTKMMIIADTHIMGPIKSVKLDKLRREWQMKQAFSISNRIFQPDTIIFLGDLFDEASFSRDEAFQKACNDFDRIFNFDHDKQEFIVIPGNHDVGFHDQMKNVPYLLQRFSRTFMSTESIELSHTPKTQQLNLILTNSMSFYNDSCLYCSQSKGELRQLELYLKQQYDQDPDRYTSPILLGHIPLYRQNDFNCSYPSRIRDKVSKGNIEGEDVLHEIASRSLLTKLKPRISISGHTHMLCHTDHQIETDDARNEAFYEITISSYNHKYAELKPGFLLMTANSTHVFTKHCNTIEEWVVVSIYLATILTIVIRVFLMNRNKFEDEIKLNPSTSGRVEVE
uniref:Metallophosphoesterase 1 n=1 Tax=Aceria tosichella TaxID=561515 RepID=A0A6G1S9G9_9ACAR